MTLNLKTAKKRISYNPETGLFLRLHPCPPNSKNGEFAGTMSQGYLKVGLLGKRYLAHRLAWFLYHGEWPKNQIDHIDQNKKNNRINNLRDVPAVENQRNRKLHKTNITGIMGVWWDGGIYRAYIGIERKTIYLGANNDFFEACCMRKSAESKQKYHPNHGVVIK